MPSYRTHHTTVLPVVKPIPMPPSVLQRMIDRATAQAETEATKALGLNFSQYTNAELDTIKTAAQAERRRRWLVTVPENIKRQMDGRGDYGDPTMEI